MTDTDTIEPWRLGSLTEFPPTLVHEWPPTIISFSDAMKLLKMARDTYINGSDDECFHACRTIAKAFEWRVQP